MSESTTSPDQSFIDSPFEDIDNNIPLIAILKNLVLLDSVELMLMLILIFIVINKYLYKFNIKLLYKLVLLIPNKYLPNIFKNRFNNLDKAVDFNNKFYNILFGILIIILLLFKLAHIYFSSELYSNIDDYILVYNYIKKSNLLLLVIPFLPNKFKFNGLTKLPCSNIINKFTLSGFVLLCFIWYFYPLSCYIFNSVIFAVITIFILTGTLIFRILYLNNIYKYKIPIVVKINMKNHLLRIDLIKIATFIAPILGLFFNKLFCLVDFIQFYFVLMFVLIALLALASESFINYAIKFYIELLTLDEVLQEYSINLAKGVQNMVHSFSCKPVYIYMSVDRGYFSNFITRRYSTSAIDKRDIENLGEKKLKINMDSSKIDQLKKYKCGYKSYINIFNMKNKP